MFSSLFEIISLDDLIEKNDNMQVIINRIEFKAVNSSINVFSA
jgi:hypothetical protein